MVNMAIEELEKFLLADFIELSISPFFNQLICGKKTNRALRAFIDFWKIKKDVIFNAYLFHRVEDQLQAKDISKWLSN